MTDTLNNQEGINNSTSNGDIEGSEVVEKENEKIVKNSYTDPNTGKFKEGNPGKPKGATHKKKLVDLIEEEAEKISIESGMTNEQAKRIIAKTIATIMLEGKDTSLIKEYWQQKDGKPKQPLVGGDEDDSSIKIELSEKVANKNKLYDASQLSESGS